MVPLIRFSASSPADRHLPVRAQAQSPWLWSAAKARLRSVWLPALALFLFAGTVAPALARDVVRLPVPYIQQPDGNTCLPTSLCMAMHFMGRCDLTTETIYKLHKTTQYDRYNVPELAARYGLYAFPSWLEHAWTRETVEAELRAGHPVILGLDCSQAGHFVLAVGYTDDAKVIIHDPYWKEPGWYFGGPYVTTDWERLIWRNGIIVRGEPFSAPLRTISGTLVDSTAPRTLLCGEQSEALFAIKNNGRKPWPEGVQLAAVDAYCSPTCERLSPFAVLTSSSQEAGLTSGTWISASRAAAPDRPRIAPGEVAYFRVPLRAPAHLEANRTTVFRENFNLIDAQGHWFSEHWQTGPSNRQIFFRVAVAPPPPKGFALPLVESVTGGKPVLDWKLKYGTSESLSVAADAPAFATGGADVPTSPAEALLSLAKPDSPALRLSPPPGQTDQVAFIGDPKGTDYRVEAWIYCNYRPQDKNRAFERVGVFMRDSGHHRFGPKTELESDESLVMAYDSDDGKLRLGTFALGGVNPLLRETSTPLIQNSGWHRFAIRAEGTTVTYELDGKQVAAVNLARRHHEDDDDTHPRSAYRAGDCGVFFHSSHPAEEADRPRGLLFAGFRVDQ